MNLFQPDPTAQRLRAAGYEPMPTQSGHPNGYWRRWEGDCWRVYTEPQALATLDVRDQKEGDE